MWKTFETFSFGPNYIKIVKLCYTVIETTIFNGYSSKWFQPTRGIRQVCPLSGRLFILVAELLAQIVRNNHNIDGIQVADNITKIKQFADNAFKGLLYFAKQNKTKQKGEPLR